MKRRGKKEGLYNLHVRTISKSIRIYGSILFHLLGLSEGIEGANENYSKFTKSIIIEIKIKKFFQIFNFTQNYDSLKL